MKFIVKFFIILITLTLFIVSENKENIQSPQYETPEIRKADSPLNNSIHPRLAILNQSSQFKRSLNTYKDIITSSRSNLSREFSVRALDKWIDNLSGRNLELITGKEFMQDISDIKGFSKTLQQWIISKSNNVLSQAALIDLKIKELELIDEEIIKVQNNPGNINSNLGGNLPFREQLEDIISNTPNLSSEFSIPLNGICKVINKITGFIKSVKSKSNVLKNRPETQFYPQNEIISENQLQSSNEGIVIENNEDNIDKNISEDEIGDFFGNLFEIIEDSILDESNKLGEIPITNSKGKKIPVIEKIYSHEIKLDHLPKKKSKQTVHEIIHAAAAEIAMKITKKTIKKLNKNTKLNSVTSSDDKKKIIKKNVKKAIIKTTKKAEEGLEKKENQDKSKKSRYTAENLILKSSKNLLKEENLDNISNVIFNLLN